MNYRPFNQVTFRGDLASIARVYEESADILVIRSENDSEYLDGVSLEELLPIEMSKETLKSCKFSDKIILGRKFSFEKNHFRVDAFDNGHYIIYKDEEIIKEGNAKYLHELQNIIGEYINGYYIFI